MAQIDARFGLVASPLISFFSPDATNISNDGAKFGGDFGLLADLGFRDNYAFSTGFLVAYKGGKLTFADTGSHKIQLQFLEIPLTMKMKTNQIGYITYWGNIGLLPGIRIRARSDFKGQNLKQDNVNLIKDDNPTGIKSKLFNFSLTVSLGIEYELTGKTALLLGAYFNNGFVNLFDDGDDEKIVQRTPGIRAGVIF